MLDAIIFISQAFVAVPVMLLVGGFLRLGMRPLYVWPLMCAAIAGLQYLGRGSVYFHIEDAAPEIVAALICAFIDWWWLRLARRELRQSAKDGLP